MAKRHSFSILRNKMSPESRKRADRLFWHLFRRWRLLDTKRFTLHISTRFPPRLNLWFWRHNWPEGYDFRLWPIDLWWKKSNVLAKTSSQG